MNKSNLSLIACTLLLSASSLMAQDSLEEAFKSGKASGEKYSMGGGLGSTEQQTEQPTQQPIEQPTQPNNDFQSLIKRFVIRKDRIAYAVWVFLISSLTSSIAARLIVDSGN